MDRSFSLRIYLKRASKLEKMYNGQVKRPLIVRTPMGGHHGYSQSIDALFLGDLIGLVRMHMFGAVGRNPSRVFSMRVGR